MLDQIRTVNKSGLIKRITEVETAKALARHAGTTEQMKIRLAREGEEIVI